MSGVTPDTAHHVSRRDFISTAAVGSLAIAGASVIGSPAFAADKVSQKTAAYQPTAKGNQQCDKCQNFQPPASCKLVDGSVSPSGWCTLFKAK